MSETWGIWFPDSEGWLKRASDGKVFTYPTKAGAAAHLHDWLISTFLVPKPKVEARRIGDDGLPMEEPA